MSKNNNNCIVCRGKLEKKNVFVNQNQQIVEAGGLFVFYCISCDEHSFPHSQNNNGFKEIVKKASVYVLLLFAFINYTYGQGYSGCHGGVGDDFAYSSASLFNESYILSSTSSYSTEASAIGLIKLDTAGNLLWTKEVEGGSSLFAITWATKIKAYQNNLFFTGYTNDNTGAAHEFIVAKADTAGNILWSKKFGDVGTDRPYGLTFIGDFIYVAGYETQVGGAGYNRIILSKMDINGNLLWMKIYGNDTNLDFAMDVTSFQNRLYLTGFTSSFSNSNDGFVMCVDSSGTPVWTRLISSSGGDNFYSINILNSTIIATGESDFNSNGGKDIVVVQLDTNGNLLQGKKIGSLYTDYGRTSTVLNNKLYVSGWVSDPTASSYLLEIDTSLNVSNSLVVGSTDGTEKLRGLSNDGVFINAIGYSDASSLTSPGNGGIKKDPYLLRFLSMDDISCDTVMNTPFDTSAFDLTVSSVSYVDSTLIVTATNLSPIITSLTFLSNQNCSYQPSSVGVSFQDLSSVMIYPNPAHSVINIKNNDHILTGAKIYSIEGKLIKSYSILNSKSIDIANLSNGYYIVSLYQNDKKTKTFRFIKN